jgi:hypothetical protein
VAQGCKLAIENCLENGMMVMVVVDGKLKKSFSLKQPAQFLAAMVMSLSRHMQNVRPTYHMAA